MASTIKKLIYLIIITVLLSSCASINKKEACTEFNAILPEGVAYKGKVYWKTDILKSQDEVELLGKIKTVVDCNDFPKNDLEVTLSAEKYIGSTVSKYGNTLYVNFNNETIQFDYYDKMEIGEEITDSDNSVLFPPHYVYKNMLYFPASIIIDIQFDDIPSAFLKVGTIKEEIKVHASRNYTSSGIPKGTQLYASENQNRFMIVKYPNGNIEMLECLAYRE